MDLFKFAEDTGQPRSSAITTNTRGDSTSNRINLGMYKEVQIPYT